MAIRQGSHICIASRNIQGRIIPDDNTIVFRMSDGSYWKNMLQKPCQGLRMAGGFALATSDDYICSDQQRIRVMGQGNTCWLGAFSRTSSPFKT